MSFNFTLSSDEENEYEWQVKSESASTSAWASAKVDEDDPTQHDGKETEAFPLLNDWDAVNRGDEEEEDEDDEAFIDWEDADEKEEEEEEDKKTGGESRKLASDTSADAETATPSTVAGSPSLQPVTIKFGDLKQPATNTKKSPEDSSKKPKTRHVYRNSRLPDNVRSLLRDLQRTHLLAVTSYAVLVSKYCCDSNVLAVALSLIPSTFWVESESIFQHKVPTTQQLIRFCTWFFDLVNHVEERRRRNRRQNIAAGAHAAQSASRRRRRKRKEVNPSLSNEKQQNTPCSLFLSSSNTLRASTATEMLEYCSYLSNSNDENPQLLDNEQNPNVWQGGSGQEKIQLFLAMARSMGWRARYIVSIDPVRQDLDVNHPLLMSTFGNIFQMVSRCSIDGTNKKSSNRNASHRNDEEKKPKSRKRARMRGEMRNGSKNGIHNDTATSISMPAASSTGTNGSMISWIEILCQDTRGKNHKKEENGDVLRWVHIDPLCELVDQPKLVEIISKSKEENLSWKRTKQRKTIAYALAAEHCPLFHKSKLEGRKNRNNEQEQQEKEEVLFRARLTDVTPRYASRWFESLKVRGFTTAENTKRGKLMSMRNNNNNISIQELEDTWWSKTLKSLNQVFRQQLNDAVEPRTPMTTSTSSSLTEAKLAAKSGTSSVDAIELGDSSSDENKERDPLPSLVSNTHEDGDNDSEDDADRHEKQELEESALTEALPTSKGAYKNHPLYVIPSVLKTGEVLAPDAKSRICGFFKGEPVLRRSDVSSALPAKKWLYQGRKVRENELSKPVKRVKSRKNQSSNKGFKALKSYGVGESNDGSAENQAKEVELASKPLDDGLQDTYGIWQTEPWSPPPVGPNDDIPVNEYKNVELELLNPGLAHIAEPKIAFVAKTLGIPYAPCLLGFEGHGGNRTPTIKGIVVHEHNTEILREASVEVVSRLVEKENEDRRKKIYSRWKKLLVGILTKDRLEREYGDETAENET